MFQRSLLEQVGQDETRRFGFHAVNPEVSTAGVVLVTAVHQLEVVRLRIKGLAARVHVEQTHSTRQLFGILNAWPQYTGGEVQ